MSRLAPVLYLPHGGGPLPLLGDPAHRGLVSFLHGLADRIPRPDAILLVSAHWEAAVPSLTSGAAPPLVYDYYGFPPESYRLRYPAPGEPQLAAETAALIEAGGLDAALVERGYDHGMFVPLSLLYPAADIPCVQLSLLSGLDAARHLALGRCLAPLRERNVAIIGSGMSFHNLQAIFAGEQPQLRAASDQFDVWLRDTLASELTGEEARSEALANWHTAPQARFCHPRAEHLLPLHVCYGAASVAGGTASVLFNEVLMGHRVSGFGWL